MIKTLITRLLPKKWIAWTWTVIVVIACLWPGKSIPNAPAPGFDKVVHALLFFTWTILWLSQRKSNATLVILIGLIFDLFTEICQQLLPISRTFDWWDALTDAAGIFSAYLFKKYLLDPYLQRLY